MFVVFCDQGVWWYRSIKFSSDQVLLNTTRLYYYFINKTPNMILKREWELVWPSSNA